MKKRKTAAFLAALMICAWVPQAVPGDFGVLVAEAHSGRTDRYGGHRDNKNKRGLGSYHDHCGGHPAHLHENGVCPYASYVEEATPAVSPEETQSVSCLAVALVGGYSSGFPRGDGCGGAGESLHGL